MKILILEDDPLRMEQFKLRIQELNESEKEHTEMIHVDNAKDCIV